jgi:predicted  nucleic acid-binding Zn-ribbon protein
MSRDLPTTGSFSEDPKALRRQVQELEQRLRSTLKKLDQAVALLERSEAQHAREISALEARVAALEP